MLKTAIIDDEKDSQDVLKNLLQKYCSDLEIIGMSESVTEGIHLINQTQPDLVFLDVELQDGTGFDILKKIPERPFHVIFISAFNHYSLKAIKFSALDFLVKPIDASELVESIEKYRKKRSEASGNSIHDYDVLLENLRAEKPRKLAIPCSDGLEYLDIAEVLYMKADGSYVQIFLQDGTSRVIAKNLKDFHSKLKDDGYFRIHNSYLINLRHMKKYHRKDGGLVRMSDNTLLPISKAKLELFKNAAVDFAIKI
jgi:two-component system LytT family response regulator